MTQATLPALADLAFTYHDFGFNALPLANPAKTATKHPAIPWKKGEKDYTQEHFTHDDISNHVARYNHGIIAITGIGNNHNIDFDKIKDFSIVDEFLDLLELPHDYPWVVLSGSGAGAQIWIHNAEPGEEEIKDLSDYDARDKARFDHVELRWRGNCCVLPPSVHPSGKLYQFRSGTFPDGGPAAVSLERIKTALETISTLRHAAKEQNNVNNINEVTSITGQDEDTSYGLSALRDECQDLASTPAGGRNHRLNLAAFRMGQLVGGGELTDSTGELEVLDAASKCGLDESEARATFKSGFEKGLLSPRSAPVFERMHDAPYDTAEDALDLDSLTLENAKKLIIELRKENQQLKEKDTWWNTIMSNPKLKTVQKLMIRQRIEVEQHTKPGRKKDGKWWWRIDTEKDGKATGSDGTTISRNVPYLVAGGVLETWNEPIILKNGQHTHIVWSRLTGAEKLPADIMVPSKWGGKTDRCTCGGEFKVKSRVIERQRVGTCKNCGKVRVFQPEKVKSPLPVTPVHLDEEDENIAEKAGDETATEAHAENCMVHDAPVPEKELEMIVDAPSVQSASSGQQHAKCTLGDFQIGHTYKYKSESVIVLSVQPLWLRVEGRNRRVFRIYEEDIEKMKPYT